MQAVLAVAGEPNGLLFSAPVGGEAPGYRREIACPMDLSTIAARLDAGAYASLGA